jgi:hypothetical protein
MPVGQTNSESRPQTASAVSDAARAILINGSIGDYRCGNRRRLLLFRKDRDSRVKTFQTRRFPLDVEKKSPLLWKMRVAAAVGGVKKTGAETSLSRATNIANRESHQAI